MKELDNPPAHIAGYLMQRIQKLESMVEDLGQRNAELLAWMMEHNEHYAEVADEAASFFALIERNRA